MYVLPLMRTRKKRYNLMLDPELHAWAMQQAEKAGVSLSAYVTALIEAEWDKKSGDVKMTKDERDELRKEVAEDVLKVLLRQRRG